MRHMLEDPAEMTPDQRRREVAAILAVGVPAAQTAETAGTRPQ